MLPELIYRPSDKELSELLVQHVSERKDSSLAAADIVYDSALRPSQDECLVIQGVNMTVITGGAQTLTEFYFAITNYNEYVILRHSRPGAAGSYHLYRDTPIILPANWRLYFAASFNAGVALNQFFTWITGFKIPRGAIAP